MNIELYKAFERLKEIVENPKFLDEEGLKNELKYILSKIPLNIVDFHKGRFIERAVSNNDINELHTSASRLSYKPSHLNESIQRASLAGKTMFYGSVLFLGAMASHREIKHERIIGCFEANDLLRKDLDGENYMTFGKWEVVKDISLVCFINPYNKYDADYLRQLQTNQNKLIEDTLEDKEDIELVKDIYNFISNEFSKEVSRPEDYFVSALISDFLASHNYSVYYPSVQIHGQGMCVAITPDTADEKLVLKKALMCRITKSKKDVQIFNLMIGIPNDQQIEYEVIKEDE